MRCLFGFHDFTGRYAWGMYRRVLIDYCKRCGKTRVR